jgi:acetoin utilization protein AcuB
MGVEMNNPDTAVRGVAGRVGDHMSRDVIVLGPWESCLRARAMMEAAAVNRLPIVEEGRLIGIVTDGDLRRRVPCTPEGDDDQHSRDELLPHVKVGGVMTYGPVTGSPFMSLDEAAHIMRLHRIHTLPVVVDGMSLVGILTMGDVARARPGAPEAHRHP